MNMGVRSWILIVAEVVVINLLVFHVVAQSPKGFISIDCGGQGGRDPNTNLDWTSNGDYLQAAEELDREGVTINATVSLGPSTKPLDNAERLESALIFFPGNSDRLPRSKYCYELPVEYNISGVSKNYLLRATFPSRNLSTTAKDINGEPIPLNAHSTRFYYTVDSTFIATVELDELHHRTIELIITPIDISVYVCLVPLEDKSSMPAISSLELRPFSYGMYARSFDVNKDSVVRAGQTSYLFTVVRSNFGGDPDLPSLRYPTDPYDRLWFSPRIPSTETSEIISVKNVTDLNITSNIEIVQDVDPPVAVMSTAWEATSLKGSIEFTSNLSAPGIQPPTNYYFNILLSDVFETSNATRFIDILYDEGNGMQDAYLGIVMESTNWYQVSSKMMTFIGDFVTTSIRVNGSSTLPALVNGVELYGEFNAVRKRTLQDDAGDPCLPIPWAWLVCSIELPPRVSQINLTSKGVGGNLPFVFGRLKRLTVLDLSNNSFSGNLPGSLGNITSLRVLNVEKNNLSGELPTFALHALGNLETLSLSTNRLSGKLSSLVTALDDTIFYLNLSKNLFSGPLSSEIENLTNVQNLDLSNNQLSGELKVDLVKLRRLQFLNLRNNRLDGLIPDTIWRSTSLETVNLEGNRFTELNLTSWYFSIMAAKSFHTDEGRQKVRLAGNKIKNIIAPPLQDLESKIIIPSKGDQMRLLNNPVAFILLADNPWCQERSNQNSSLITRYLCRSDENADFYLSSSTSEGISTTAIIIAGVICGLVLSLVICLFLFFFWRMQRRTHELHQIQEALAKENVKPPFYNYDDLKSATNSFSRNSILGKGGFGTVYKAELPDGSVVAVKRLNPTQQNTSDFLKEMVNISGIKHRHLLQLKGCCVREKQERMLVYEYAENKNLAEALWGQQKPFVLSWEQRFNICMGIARGLSYLHEGLHPKMVHRDIKPQNILLDKDYNAKIADFGLVRPATTEDTQITVNIGGTRGYCSPEYISEGIVSEKLDVYSFGVVILEIVSGRMCINYKLPEDQMILRSLALDLYVNGNLLDLVDTGLMGNYDDDEVLLVLQTALACCQLDSNKRPTMSQVLNTFMKNADVAIDIVRELRGQRPQVDSLLEDYTGQDPTNFKKCEENALINSVNSTPITQLSGR